MTRHPIPWLLGTPIALIVSIYAAAEPGKTTIVLGGTLWLAGIVGGIAAVTRLGEEKAKRKDSERRCEALETDLLRVIYLNAELDQENARLHLELTEAQIAGGVVLPFPSIPTQRDGAHDRLPVADVVVPIHTAVDDDELTALMRAVEEK